jgi:hypothetical protein
MQKYRLCWVSEDGRRIDFEELACRDDGEAIMRAKRLVRDYDLEVWNGDLFVFSLECKQR